MADVHVLNADARALLGFLHDCSIRAHGGPYIVHAEAKSYAACGLDAARYAGAMGRLLQKRLAKPMALGGGIMITDSGVEVAEDEELLDAELPIEPRRRAVPEVPSDVADALSDVRAVSLDFMVDEALRAIVTRDLDELERALGAGLHKCTGILAGSISEALLIDVLDRNRSVAQSYLKKRKFPEEASLGDLVTIAVDKKLLEEVAGTMVGSLQDFRDLVHPDRERRLKPKIDGATSGALVSLLRLVVRDLADAEVAGRIAAYVDGSA